MSETLLDHTKRVVEEISMSLAPDADVLPVLLTKGPMGMSAMGIVMPPNEDEKDGVARAIACNIACLGATEVVFVTCAWIVAAPPGEDVVIRPSEHPDRTEVFCIMHSTAEGVDEMYTSDVIRRRNQPPVMGNWSEPHGDGIAVGGRFGDAIHLGLALAKDLSRDEQTEAREAIDDLLASDGIHAAVKAMLDAWDAVATDGRAGRERTEGGL